MDDFIGRHRELDMLQRRYGSGRFECIIVYGRRRVGKTTLIRRFVQGKPCVFFSAIESSAQRNLEVLSASIALLQSGMQDLSSDAGATAAVPAYPVYRDFASAIERIFQLASDKRMVFVIDEYPYLAAADPSVSSVLQHAIDRHQENSKLDIVLCGSSMSFMEKQVLGYKSPLYGRRTAQIKVEPFTYREVLDYFPGMPEEQAAVVYGITNGIPQYCRQWDSKKNVADNIRDNVIDPDCYLFEETTNILKQEMRNPAEYNNIIQTIASGASKLNEIATGAHMPSGMLVRYLTNLMELGIVVKERPFGEKAARKTLYHVGDSFFRFWYGLVAPCMVLIQSGREDIAVQRIMQQLPTFMGPVYETMCKQWLLRHNGESLPFVLSEIGHWWGADPRTRRQEEIDIVASDGKDKALYAECKWRNEQVGVAELTLLRQRSQLLRHSDKYYALFSKSGFTEELERAAGDDPHVMLVSFQQMCK